jgi:hypothetical protein
LQIISIIQYYFLKLKDQTHPASLTPSVQSSDSGSINQRPQGPVVRRERMDNTLLSSSGSNAFTFFRKGSSKKRSLVPDLQWEKQLLPSFLLRPVPENLALKSCAAA